MSTETNLDHITDADIARWKRENRDCAIVNYVLARFAEEKMSAAESLCILDKVRKAIENATHCTAWGDTLTCPVVQNTMCRWREGDIEEKINRQLAASQGTNKEPSHTAPAYTMPSYEEGKIVFLEEQLKFNEVYLNGKHRQYVELKKQYHALEEQNAELQKTINEMKTGQTAQVTRGQNPVSDVV